MKKIINNFNKRLSFPSIGFSIDANEVKEIDDEIFNQLIQNQFISEFVKHDSIILENKKGRQDNQNKKIKK